MRETPIAEYCLMRLVFCAIFVCLSLLDGFSQEQEKMSWQQLWQDYVNAEDMDGDATEQGQYEDNMALLQQLAETPIDINRASFSDLMALPFLSEQQVMDIMGYRDTYYPVRSMGEMRMVRSLDYTQLALLGCFAYVGEVTDTLRFPSVKTITMLGRNELSASVRVPFYERRGDRNGYLGYPYRHWLKYDFHYSDYVRFGFVGAQDAGEPFFSNRNTTGYDSYSYYVQVRKLGTLDNLVVGKFRIASGMGLILNNSFQLGKMSMLQTKGRQTETLSPHATGSIADYLQGAAVALKLSKHFKMTAYGSVRPIDATLNKDGTVATILKNGYHRTPIEMAKKHNTTETDLGAMLSFSGGGLRLGATVAYTHLDRQLKPDNGQLYRRYFPAGKDFLNYGVNYSYMHHRFSLSGETAVDGDGHVATLNVLSYQPEASWSAMIAQRFYSYRYASLHGHAFGEGSRVQNESGVYVGFTWQPLSRLELRGYADFAYFPLARYRVSRDSWAKDYLVEAAYKLSRSWTMKGRYRMHLREMDNKSKTALRQHNDHRVRLSLGYDDGCWSFTTRGDYVRAANEDISNGWMVSENVGWRKKWWRLGVMAAYFNTDSYDSRRYVNEQQLPHSFSSLSVYGRGLRLSLIARAMVGSHLQFDAKLGYTKYRDRTTIGTGLQQIDASHMTDLDVQARWRF